MKIQLEPFPKIRSRAAADICAKVELSAQARSYLVPDLSPQAFLSVLTANDCHPDAVRFFAFALPPREGVWWACVFARTIAPAIDARSEPCVRLAEEWVYEPSEEGGRACFAAAEAVQFVGAGAYAALAAFWAGSNMAPPGGPVVPPDPTLSPIGVGASVLLAVASGDPAKAATLFRDAIALAVDIANGGNGRGGAANG